MHIVPILHPAYLLRGKWGEGPAQVLALRRAWRVASEGYKGADVTRPPPGASVDPTVEELEKWTQEVLENPSTLAVDIECAGSSLMCVGFCRTSDFSSTVFRFLRKGGQRAYLTGDAEQAHALCARLLASPSIPLVFHNGQNFDIPYLEAQGFEVQGYSFDTMLGHFVAWPEVPKGLAYLAKIHLGIPSWKFLSDLKEEGEGKA